MNRFQILQKCATHLKIGENEEISITFSSTMRELRKKYPNQVLKFMEVFKQAFEVATEEQLEDPEQAALLEALQKI